MLGLKKMDNLLLVLFVTFGWFCLFVCVFVCFFCVFVCFFGGFCLCFGWFLLLHHVFESNKQPTSSFRAEELGNLGMTLDREILERCILKELKEPLLIFFFAFFLGFSTVFWCFPRVFVGFSYGFLGFS